MSHQPSVSPVQESSSEESVVISSLVVEVERDEVDNAVEALNALEGVEVHEVNDYKIVVTIEASSTQQSHSISSRFVEIPGVLNINLIYVNFEDETLGVPSS